MCDRLAETTCVRPSVFLGCLLAALVAALVSSSAAVADRVQVNRADQATAKRAVLRLSDLPSAINGWKATKLSSNNSATPASCAQLDYTSSQIVDTGQAGSQFTTPGILVMNRVGVFAKTSTLRLVWQHVFGQPMARCLGDAVQEGGAGRVTVLSTAKLPFPRLAAYESADRIIFRLSVHGKPVRAAFDVVILGSGRTLSLLMVMGILGTAGQQAAAGAQVMTLIDLHVAQAIAQRAFANKPLA